MTPEHPSLEGSLEHKLALETTACDVNAIPTVLVWRAGEDELDTLQALCERLQQSGWLETLSDDTVIQIDCEWHGDLVLRTASAMIACFSRHRPTLRISVLMLGDADKVPTGSFSQLRLPGTEYFRLRSPCLPHGVEVPAFWLKPVSIITVTSAGPSRLGRLGAVLASQAKVLKGRTRMEARIPLAYEAHRLGSSSLAIVCGTGVHGDKASGAWWAVSQSDVMLERAVARAAGLDADRLPFLRHIAKWESPNCTILATEGSLPTLVAYAGQRWISSIMVAWDRLALMLQNGTQDFALAASNLRRAPGFMRRHLVGLTERKT